MSAGLIPRELAVVVTTSSTGALQRRIRVAVTDQAGVAVVGCVVSLSVKTTLNLVTFAVGPTGKLVARVLDGSNALATLETGAAGTVDVDTALALAGTGEAYALGLYPGPGRGTATWTF